MWRSLLTDLECTACKRRALADQPQGVCPACGKVLFARYDLAGAARAVDRSALAGRPANVWRLRELLPVREERHALTLGEGMTPLLPARRLGARLGCLRLYVKEEGQNPTGSFKARGMAAAVARAWELGLTHLAAPTAGNAGGALAAYAARAGLAATVLMPADAPAVNKAEAVVHGARVFL